MGPALLLREHPLRGLGRRWHVATCSLVGGLERGAAGRPLGGLAATPRFAREVKRCAPGAVMSCKFDVQ